MVLSPPPESPAVLGLIASFSASATVMVLSPPPESPAVLGLIASFSISVRAGSRPRWARPYVGNVFSWQDHRMLPGWNSRRDGGRHEGGSSGHRWRGGWLVFVEEFLCRMFAHNYLPPPLPGSRFVFRRSQVPLLPLQSAHPPCGSSYPSFSQPSSCSEAVFPPPSRRHLDIAVQVPCQHSRQPWRRIRSGKCGHRERRWRRRDRSPNRRRPLFNYYLRWC